MAVLTPLQVAAAAYAGGFRGNAITEAVAVSFGESSWNTAAENPCCKGLMAINVGVHQRKIQAIVPNWNWRDPVHNMQAAFMIWRGAGGTFAKDWVQTYRKANYQRALPQARVAATQLAQELAKNQGDQQGVIRRLLGNATSQVGSTPGESVADSVTGAVTNVIPGIAEVGSFFKALTDPNTWIRVAEVGLGVLLIAVALAQLAPTSALVKATPVGRIARVIK